MRAALLLPALLAQALLAPAPLHAQDKPAWVGVWQGTIGKLPVRACLDTLGTDGPGRGSYYYLSRLEPIALSESEEWEGGWDERAPGSESGAFWEMDDFDGQRIRGTWHQGDGASARTLPLALDPAAWTEGEWGGPCSSDAFLGPRAGKGETTREEAGLDGWRYTRLIWQPPAQFAEDVAIETFTFATDQPGDAAILTALPVRIPGGAAADDYLQCLGGAIASLGYDGNFDEGLEPTLASKAFLVAEHESGTFCGGAHPNYYTLTHTWDRRTGAEVDLFDWLGPPRTDGEGPVLSAELRALVLARWPNAEAECRDYAAETQYWSLGLARDGLVFRPDFPHALTPCEEPITLDWDALGPFLDQEGRAGLARLREG